MRRTASEIIRDLEIRIARLEKKAANFKFNTMYYSSELIAYFYPLSKLKNGKIQGVQMDIRRGKVRMMSHLDSDFRLLGMELETDISAKDEKKILDYANNARTASEDKTAGTGLDAVLSFLPLSLVNPNRTGLSRKARQLVLSVLFSEFVECFSERAQIKSKEINETYVERDQSYVNTGAFISYYVMVPYKELSIELSKAIFKADRVKIDPSEIKDALMLATADRKVLSEAITKQYESRFLSNDMDIEHYAFHDNAMNVIEADSEDLYGDLDLYMWEITEIRPTAGGVRFSLNVQLDYDLA